jgi:hypothetical protein
VNELIMAKRAAGRVGELGLFVTQFVSEDDFRELPFGHDLLVTARTARNPAQLARAWVLAQKIADACDWLGDKETAMEWLKLKARHAKMLVDPGTGEIALVPKSIAFASLDQQAFSRLFDRFIYVTCNEIIPGVEQKALRKAIEEMVS